MAEEPRINIGEEGRIPAGYRQGFITSITVLITASLLFFRFMAFEPGSGPWTMWGRISVAIAGVSIVIQLGTLWRALQPKDEEERVYTMTLWWFAAAVLTLVTSFITSTIANM